MPIIPEPYFRTAYRGLNEFEEDMLREYLRREEPDITRLETRVRVGPGDRIDRPAPEALKEAWRQQTQFKIDVLMWTESVVRVLEIKDHIRSSALGQPLAYEFWLRAERSFDMPLRLEVAAPSINPTAVRPLRFRNIRVVPLSAEAEAKKQLGLEAGRDLAEDAQRQA